MTDKSAKTVENEEAIKADREKAVGVNAIVDAVVNARPVTESQPAEVAKKGKKKRTSSRGKGGRQAASPRRSASAGWRR